jgi:lipid II isoglutaminyl synthase (glutamine-hydrolysing)
MRLRLVHLYGDLMNLYGDRGNIIALQRRCAWRGIELETVDVSIGDRLDPTDCDLFFFGGGQDQEQGAVSRDLALGTGEAIQEAVQGGASLLAVCGGYQLLGHYFRTSEGMDIPGTGLFDCHTVAGAERRVGNVVADAKLDGEPQTLVGFENHSGRTYLADGALPLATVRVGNGNNGEDRTEGIRYQHAVGTYLHGPILPKNPWLADWLIQGALQRRLGADAVLTPLDDRVEQEAHRAVVSNILRHGNVRTSIR